MSLITCKECGAKISNKAVSCPTCGSPVKQKTTVFVWFVTAFFILMATLIIIGSEDETTNVAAQQEPPKVEVSTEIDREKQKKQLENDLVVSLVPPRQASFNGAVYKYSKSFKGAKNELQQDAVREQRRIEVSKILNGYLATSWIGKISSLGTTPNGKAYIDVITQPGFSIKTWNNPFSDAFSNTLIEKDSPAHNSLLNLTEGQFIRFSGTFLPSEKDYIEETSVTIAGSMLDPDFLFVFDSIQAIDYRLWLSRAKQSDAYAQFDLGGIYYYGILGADRNSQKALKWWKRAAEQGDSPAQFQLGASYQYGDGVIQDRKEAIKWYRLAAKQGLQAAQDKLDALE